MGLFAVMVTATGCLFFLDTNTVALSSGLSAAGVLLMLLNVAYIALMAILITKQGARHVHGWATWTKDTSQKTITAIWRLLSCHVCGSARSYQGSQHISQAATAPAKSMQLSGFTRMLSRSLSSLPLKAAEVLPESNVSSIAPSGAQQG